MGIKLTKLPELSPENLTESESHLWLLLREREECIQQLKDEIARLKGEKGKPKIKPSRLEPKEKASQPEADGQESPGEEKEDSQKKKKRPGSAKRNKTANLPIHETKLIQPTQEIPAGSEFKGYQDYTVQELIVRAHNTLYRMAIWQRPTGEYLRGKLPEAVREQGHFGVMLKSYLLYQYHHCHVTQPKLLQQMWEWGIDISAGQLNRILVEDKDSYHVEKRDILQVGLSVSNYINTDDTSARHQGVNSYCTHIGNEWFAWFETTSRKNRINFLELLRGQRTDYVLSSEALTYMSTHKLPQSLWLPLSFSINRVFKHKEEWLSYLKELGIEKKSHVKTATEGALLGAVIASGVSADLGIVSDGAGQFRLLEHAYKKLTSEEQQQQKGSLEEKFDQIFTTSTSFETLNQVLRRLNRRKAELLKVLDKPELPLHNNASEQDIREFVTKRKLSGSTRSELGRRCRDTFASLKKTCRKLGVSFWEYLMDRVSGKNLIPTLGELVAKKAVESQGTLAETASLSFA